MFVGCVCLLGVCVCVFVGWVFVGCGCVCLCGCVFVGCVFVAGVDVCTVLLHIGSTELQVHVQLTVHGMYVVHVQLHVCLQVCTY